MKEYLQTADDVLLNQRVTTRGLEKTQVDERIASVGANVLDEPPKRSMLSRIWAQVCDPMIFVLVAAGVVSGLFKEIADMVIILVVVVLNTVLGIVQESKAEKAVAALQKLSAPHTKVRRGGNVIVVPSSQLVPGDIVLLEAGDSVPADMRLIKAASLKIEEAALTGESVPSDKTVNAISGGEDTPLGDRINMAYMGTNVTYGRGEGVVVYTGMSTEMGKIADILSNTQEEKTPLQQKLAGLGKVLSIAVLGICAFIFVFDVLRGGGLSGDRVFQSLLTAVSLAVAAIPEGLVVVVTVLLSIGVTKMSARNAIIRRLTAVETLGCTQVICSDKTGTLTQNRMTVVEHYGDTPLLCEAMYLCSDVQRTEDGLIGDPTEVGLYEFAVMNGTDGDDTPRVAEAPFDSLRKMMSTVHFMRTATIRQFTKGAPDEVIAHCAYYYDDGAVREMTDERRAEILRENSRMADQALRVLAAAYRDYESVPESCVPDELERELVFIGLAGMIDPVRPEVQAAVDSCRSAGIRAVMITGDHKATAIAIARKLGILTDESQAVTGAELSEMSDGEFESRIKHISVYARVQPEHKVRIVNTWRRLGKITAMTGDGVNDAPAIKSADIGVGMGITGTDVTKNVADMVLGDDNFATIVYAVEEGRRIYENIRKAIQFLLASNLSEVVSIFIATIGGFRLFAPIHILWINLITDTFPAMALGMEAAERDAMRRPPRDSKEGIFAGGLGREVVWQGVLIALLTLASYFVGTKLSGESGMTMAFLTLSLCEVFHSLNMRSRHKSVFSIGSKNKHLLGAMLLSFVLTVGVIYIPGLNTAFSLVALPASYFAAGFGIALSVIPIVEIAKLIGRKRAK